MSIGKRQLSVSFSGQVGEPLSVSVFIDDVFGTGNAKNSDNENRIVVQSTSLLKAAEKTGLDQAAIEKRFKNLSADSLVKQFDFSQLGSDLHLPFKEITQIKNKISFLLNDSVEIVAPIDQPKLKNHPKVNAQTTLSLLIGDEKDIPLCEIINRDIYFKLPESYKIDSPKYSDLLKDNPKLIPWFPAVLIGKDYHEAVKILKQVRPEKIVTNNTGIAYKAYEMGIEWIAGPFLNTTNSYALRTLKEELNCAGAFISNEINQQQIKNIKRPKDFKLLYSIYHPILMMTSRQCFFQQTVGCNKPTIEDGCMLKCKKATTITNKKGVSFAIDKQRGGYPSIYNHEQFLNTDIVHDLSGLFDEFFIDLTDIGTGSKELAVDKSQLIQYFEDLLKAESEGMGMDNNHKSAQTQLNQVISESTHAQYIQGL